MRLLPDGETFETRGPHATDGKLLGTYRGTKFTGHLPGHCVDSFFGAQFFLPQNELFSRGQILFVMYNATKGLPKRPGRPEAPITAGTLLTWPYISLWGSLDGKERGNIVIMAC